MDKGCFRKGNSLSPVDAIHTDIEGRMPIPAFVMERPLEDNGFAANQRAADG